MAVDKPIQPLAVRARLAAASGARTLGNLKAKFETGSSNVAGITMEGPLSSSVATPKQANIEEPSQGQAARCDATQERPVMGSGVCVCVCSLWHLEGTPFGHAIRAAGVGVRASHMQGPDGVVEETHETQVSTGAIGHSLGETCHSAASRSGGSPSLTSRTASLQENHIGDCSSILLRVWASSTTAWHTPFC
jgi:hypothetical protein